MHPQPQPEFPVDRSSVEQRVIEIVAHALDKPTGAITLQSSFWNDLGAESLDMLDIAFNLERTFGVRVPHADLLGRAIDRFGEEHLIENGRITALGLDLIRRGMPEIDPARLRPGMVPLDFRMLVTVESVVRVVNRLLDYKERQVCPACAGKMADSVSNPELQCTQCRLTQPYPSGEQALMDDLEAVAREIGLPERPVAPEPVPSAEQ